MDTNKIASVMLDEAGHQMLAVAASEERPLGVMRAEWEAELRRVQQAARDNSARAQQLQKLLGVEQDGVVDDAIINVLMMQAGFRRPDVRAEYLPKVAAVVKMALAVPRASDAPATAAHADQLADSDAKREAAVRTLMSAGYTYTEGADYWRPQIGVYKPRASDAPADVAPAALTKAQRIAIKAAISISSDIEAECHDGAFLSAESVHALNDLLATNPSNSAAPSPQFKEWFVTTWDAYEDKETTSRIKAGAWALKAWTHQQAVIDRLRDHV